jgi:hypothetical protein
MGWVRNTCTRQSRQSGGFILSALTGTIDAQGGDWPGPSLLRDVEEEELSDLLSSEQKAKQLASDRFSLWRGRAGN